MFRACDDCCCCTCDYQENCIMCGCDNGCTEDTPRPQEECDDYTNGFQKGMV